MVSEKDTANEVKFEVNGEVVGTADVPVGGKEPTVQEYVRTLSGVQLLDFLQKIHPSDAHMLIRDELTKQQLYDLRNGPLDLKKRFYQIKEMADNSNKHDNTMAKMIDVDRAATRVYGILLKMIKVQNDEIEELKAMVRTLMPEKPHIVENDK